MDDSQGSPTVKSELLTGEDASFSAHQLLTYETYEREIQILERDIRQQKESSVNAKTAITFEQLRKIHNLGKLLGPQKELFFDRICRAADIQRASLKNRLKQNKEKFEPPTLTPYRSCYQEPGTPSEAAPCLMTPHWQQISQFNGGEEFERKLVGIQVATSELRYCAEKLWRCLQSMMHRLGPKTLILLHQTSNAIGTMMVPLMRCSKIVPRKPP
ncbi:hypothetical protein ANCCAN_21847 [Ancylostoma caninum]|uniref:Uncharacterized protein n=1 Tax=Ancylostoma caninum TaxID=29170 RepID=A0A368FND9_ANCCA|nr:hypothetical protein ANCCAN_21847 [Ancylostoma caninum]